MNIISIELLDGTQIPCFPKEQAENSIDNNLSLNTTGEYLQFGRRRKRSATKSTENPEKLAQEKLFLDNAFLFLANRERILSDSRMFLAQVPIQSGLAYTGTSGFLKPTLGVYLEFWLYCHHAAETDDKGRRYLVYRISGSPLTGNNSCGVVYEDGSTASMQLDNFRSLWPGFMEINKRYDTVKSTCECYSLQQVIELLNNVEHQ